MTDLKKYYEEYNATEGAYRMAQAKDSSRIRYLISFLREYVPVGGKVLDLGCGDMFLSTLAPEFEWYGMDVTPAAYAKDGRFTAHDIMSAPYPYADGTFAAVVCSEVLEHVWDLRVVHREVKRILLPQGTYILSTPNFDHIDHLLANYRQLLTDFAHDHLVQHIRFYNRKRHEDFLHECGMQPVGYMGADAHYSHFFAEARGVLLHLMNKQFGIEIDLVGVEMMLGAMFKDFSHTTMLISKPKRSEE